MGTFKNKFGLVFAISILNLEAFRDSVRKSNLFLKKKICHLIIINIFWLNLKRKEKKKKNNLKSIHCFLRKIKIVQLFQRMVLFIFPKLWFFQKKKCCCIYL